MFKGVAGEAERARGVPASTDVRITAKTGQLLEPLPEAGSYLGFIFARGATGGGRRSALRARARAVLDIVEIAARAVAVTVPQRVTAAARAATLPCGGTYPGGSAAPSPKKKSSMCFATSSWASFCQGIRRYSLRIIFIRSSHSFQASAEMLS